MSQVVVMTPRAQREQEPSGFLRRKLSDGDVDRFSLLLVNVEGSATFCDAWPVSLGFEEIRDLVEDKAARVAAMGATVCNFMLRAEGPKRPDGSREELGFESFRVASQVAKTNGSMMSEPANEAGLLAQLMRHNETNLRTTFQIQGLMFTSQAEENRRLREQVQQYEERRIEVWNLMEGLTTQKAQRELEERKAEHSQKLKEKALDSLLPLVSIASDLVMGKVHPEGQALTAANIARDLFGTLKQEQLVNMLAHLEPEQSAQVIRLYRVLAAQSEKEKAAETAKGKGAADGQIVSAEKH